jgi:hypothetical protein
MFGLEWPVVDHAGRGPQCDRLVAVRDDDSGAGARTQMMYATPYQNGGSNSPAQSFCLGDDIPARWAHANISRSEGGSTAASSITALPLCAIIHRFDVDDVGYNACCEQGLDDPSCPTTTTTTQDPGYPALYAGESCIPEDSLACSNCWAQALTETAITPYAWKDTPAAQASFVTCCLSDPSDPFCVPDPVVHPIPWYTGDVSAAERRCVGHPETICTKDKDCSDNDKTDTCTSPSLCSPEAAMTKYDTNQPCLCVAYDLEANLPCLEDETCSWPTSIPDCTADTDGACSCPQGFVLKPALPAGGQYSNKSDKLYHTQYQPVTTSQKINHEFYPSNSSSNSSTIPGDKWMFEGTKWDSKYIYMKRRDHGSITTTVEKITESPHKTQVWRFVPNFDSVSGTYRNPTSFEQYTQSTEPMQCSLADNTWNLDQALTNDANNALCVPLQCRSDDECFAGDMCEGIRDGRTPCAKDADCSHATCGVQPDEATCTSSPGCLWAASECTTTNHNACTQLVGEIQECLSFVQPLYARSGFCRGTETQCWMDNYETLCGNGDACDPAGAVCSDDTACTPMCKEASSCACQPGTDCEMGGMPTGISVGYGTNPEYFVEFATLCSDEAGIPYPCAVGEGELAQGRPGLSPIVNQLTALPEAGEAAGPLKYLIPSAARGKTCTLTEQPGPGATQSSDVCDSQTGEACSGYPGCRWDDNVGKCVTLGGRGWQCTTYEGVARSNYDLTDVPGPSGYAPQKFGSRASVGSVDAVENTVANYIYLTGGVASGWDDPCLPLDPDGQGSILGVPKIAYSGACSAYTPALQQFVPVG